MLERLWWAQDELEVLNVYPDEKRRKKLTRLVRACVDGLWYGAQMIESPRHSWDLLIEMLRSNEITEALRDELLQ